MLYGVVAACEARTQTPQFHLHIFAIAPVLRHFASAIKPDPRSGAWVTAFSVIGPVETGK